MKIPYYQIDAFTTEKPFSGNPAGVCILEEWLPDDLLQNIAFENNLPETAFIIEAQDHFKLRWFTPTMEMDLCGHATLAPAFLRQGAAFLKIRLRARPIAPRFHSGQND